MARDAAIRTDHLSLNTAVPSASLAPGASSMDEDAVRRKRLVYRSKQRGWLEVDLLMGTFAVAHVPSMSTDELDEYEAILNQETIEIFE